MRQSRSTTILRALQQLLLASIGLTFVVKLISSFTWRMELDTPLIHYVAFLINEHGRMPYRDIFETSMPGTFAFHCAIGRLFGYGDFAFRCVDMAMLCLLLGITYQFMRRFGRTTAIVAVLTFGMMYLAKGQKMSLQRDYLGVIPIAAALLTLPASSAGRVSLVRFSIVGGLFGVSALIKPHLGIGFPIVLGALLAARWQTRPRSWIDFTACTGVAAASLLVPPGLACYWLSINGALPSFLEMFINYLPLHSQLNGSHVAIYGPDRIKYILLQTLTLGSQSGFIFLFLAALAACYRSFRLSQADRTRCLAICCLGICTIGYWIYPAPAGKFWAYHYMPFIYFCCITAALAFSKTELLPEDTARSWWKELAMLGLFAFAVYVPMHLYSMPTYFGARAIEASAPHRGRVDAIADWLEEHQQPGDRIQSLDWTGGVVHSLLRSEAVLATRFMYDYHFYHSISEPYIQKLRLKFIEELQASSPRFIVEVPDDKPWVSGPNTTREFPELHRILKSNYHIVFRGEGFVIYERVPVSLSLD